jgi:phage tail sheath gpL-like
MTIEFDELQGEILVPTTAVENDLDSKRVGLPSLNKKLLMVGYKTSAGQASNALTYPCTTVDRAIELWGVGSQLAVMVDAALKVSPDLDLYGMSYAEDGGGVAGSNTIVLATNATGPGTLTVRIAGQLFRVGIQTGDTPTVIGDNAVTKINAHPNLPVTAGNAAGTVTLTARNKGVSSNTIRYNGSITQGIGTTAVFTGATLASGATDGDPTTDLAAIVGERYHIIVCNTEDATIGGVFKTHIESQSSALEQKWGFAIQGCTGNSAAAIVLSTAYDSYRTQVVWHQNSEEPCFQLAAAYGAERARVVNRKQSLNYHELPGISTQTDKSVWPSRSEERTAISEGIIPLRPFLNGKVEIVRNVHSRRTSPAFRDAEPQEISDFIDEDYIAIFKARYKDAALKVSSPAQQPNTLTPERAIDVVGERLLIFDALDYVQGTKQLIKQGLIKANLNATDPNRLDIGHPFLPTFPLHVTAIKKSLTTPAFLG